MIEFTVYGTPAPQGSKRFVGKSKRGRAILIESSAAVAPWRALLTAQARHHTQGTDPLEGAVAVTLVFTMPRPKTLPKGRTRPSVAPDLDKLVRAVLDALKGTVLHDDGQVVDIHATEHYPGEPPALPTPGVRITARPASA